MSLAPIMFHHFHDSKHPKIQGSLSADEFEALVLKLLKRNLICASEWHSKYMKGELKDEICLTFDDNLKSQIDVALPVMKKYDLDAYWFVYSSPLIGIPERYEIIRYFRNVAFGSVEEYFDFFFRFLQEGIYADAVNNAIKTVDFSKHLELYAFYSFNDRKYRYIRDEVLGRENYFELQDQLIKEKKFDNETLIKDIWLSKDDVKSLADSGNIIGLHSHTHPTKLADLNYEDQKNEYELNRNIIHSILPDYKFWSMAHPTNSYNNDTLSIMRDFGVVYGFCSNNRLSPSSSLELPRIDHTLLKL